MIDNKVKSILERIAIALESIADSLNENSPDDVEMLSSNQLISNALANECEEVESDYDPIQPIYEFLNSCSIQIKTVPLEDASDAVINSLADFLGKNYSALRELLIRIKRGMQKGEAINLSLKDYSQKDVSNVCQFATRLHEIAFLEQYKYYKSPQYLIKAKTTTLPLAQNFFSGQWLERFVLLSVQSTVNQLREECAGGIEFSYLLNPQISLPNGDDFELDLFFHINNNFYWIEAKTGDYQQHISKYSKISKLLNLDIKHSIMVLTDIQPEKTAILSSLFAMNVSPLSQLGELLNDNFRQDLLVR